MNIKKYISQLNEVIHWNSLFKKLCAIGIEGEFLFKKNSDKLKQKKIICFIHVNTSNRVICLMMHLRKKWVAKKYATYYLLGIFSVNVWNLLGEEEILLIKEYYAQYM